VAFNRPIPESNAPRRPGGRYSSLVEAEKMVQIAILLPASTVIGWLFGAWLDERFHQAWMGLAGLLFGGFSGLYYVIRLVTTAGKRSRSAADASGAGPASGSGTGEPGATP
jgi:F0F1-type ATP synthase assembly protein I